MDILEDLIIDILENEIWDIGPHYGKIKTLAIKRLTKAVSHIDVEPDTKSLCDKEKCIGYAQIGKNACVRCERTAQRNRYIFRRLSWERLNNVELSSNEKQSQ